MYSEGGCVSGYTPLGEGAAADYQRSFIIALFFFVLFIDVCFFKVKSGKKPTELVHPHRLDAAGEV